APLRFGGDCPHGGDEPSHRAPSGIPRSTVAEPGENGARSHFVLHGPIHGFSRERAQHGSRPRRVSGFAFVTAEPFGGPPRPTSAALPGHGYRTRTRRSRGPGSACPSIGPNGPYGNCFGGLRVCPGQVSSPGVVPARRGNHVPERRRTRQGAR